VDMLTRIVGRGWWIVAGAFAATLAVNAQTPQPFPRAGQPAQAPPAPAAPRAAVPPPATQPAPPQGPPATAAGAPTAATLGFDIYPGAQFLTSYEAGRGQRFYIFGTTAPYADIVVYYKTQLREGGDVVFKEPATHQFNVGRFRQETMAFPPGVTVKDWTWGGSQGYPNPKLGGQPARFPTVIMIVPAPPPAAAPAR
jgi:hypothetical protein